MDLTIESPENTVFIFLKLVSLECILDIPCQNINQLFHHPNKRYFHKIQLIAPV